MNATTRILIATIVPTIVMGAAASSYARNPQQIISQFARAYQGKSQNNSPTRRVSTNRQIRGQFQQGSTSFGQSKRHYNGGSHCEGPYCPPRPPVYRPHCDDQFCPPPRPHVCYVYIVYYYDCHTGWITYGTYHRLSAAQAAVYDLQDQGYRAYQKRVAR